MRAPEGITEVKMMKDWEHCNKPMALAKKFFAVQGINAFAGGRPSKQLWAVRGFYIKCPPETLNLLHEYMDSIEPPQKFTMTELFHRAALWNTTTKITKIDSTTVNDYLKILEEWK